jgi:hypothetical protein
MEIAANTGFSMDMLIKAGDKLVKAGLIEDKK